MVASPDHHRSTATAWHGGQWTALYAYSSTGTVVVGLDREIEDCLDDVEHGRIDSDPVVEHRRLKALLEHIELELAAIQATDIGQEHGAAAAEWWHQDAIGGRATGDTTATARRMARGIEDGDPAVLDTLPGPRSDYGQTELEDDCGWGEPDRDDPAHTRWAAGRERLRETYELAFHDTVVHTIAEACRHEIAATGLQRLDDLRAPNSVATASLANEAVGL